jgi:hypothetical protein
MVFAVIVLSSLLRFSLLISDDRKLAGGRIKFCAKTHMTAAAIADRRAGSLFSRTWPLLPEPKATGSSPVDKYIKSIFYAVFWRTRHARFRAGAIKISV